MSSRIAPSRIATRDDRDLLVDLGRRTFFDTFAGTCSDEDMRLFLDTSFAPGKVALELAHPRSWFLLSEDQEGAFGYSRIYEEDSPPGFIAKTLPQGARAVELVRFYLDQRAIGTGAARILMEESFALCLRQGFSHVYLGVWEKNFRAQRFYEKMDFRRADTDGEKIFMVGNDPQVDWYYLRAL